MMSGQTDSRDGVVDAWAAICIITIVVSAAIFWVSGQ